MAVDEKVLTVIFDELGFPKKGVYNRVISKDLLVKAANLDSEGQRILTDYVKQINWVLLLKGSNTNVKEYQGQENDVSMKEIDYLHVELKDVGQIKKISNYLLKAIPKALIIQFDYKSDSAVLERVWVTADYVFKSNRKKFEVERIHQSVVVNDNGLSTFSAEFNFDKILKPNFRQLYLGLTESLERFNFQQENMRKPLKSAEYSDLNQRLNTLQQEFDRLSKQATQEKQINKRMKLISLARKKQAEIQQIITENGDGF